ncbi:MAG: DUF99 family protein [Methanospirillaceae archaeon]|nr:DUF99 family protein [Methanospirillaceae archaeon]
MQLQKPGIRVMGIAESYRNPHHSLLAGVVMRRDLFIDGFGFATITVGGDDGSDAIISMVKEKNRGDIPAVMISGAALAWFNILNPERISEEINTPVICVSYEESEGLIKHIERHFPGNTEKIDAYRALKERIIVDLPTGYQLYARGYGISDRETAKVCRIFTHHGRIPEPVRVARLCARAFKQSTHSGI